MNSYTPALPACCSQCGPCPCSCSCSPLQTVPLSVGSRVRCALNRRVPADCLLGNTGGNIDPELHPETVHVVSDDLYAIGISLGWESRRVCDPAAIRVHIRTLRSRTLIPKVVEVHISVAQCLQSGIMQGERLSFH